MVDLPLEEFWKRNENGKSYFNSRKGKWEDMVVVENGVSHYYLVGNLIAMFDGSVLSLSTAGWDTQLTRDRLFAIIYYGRRYMGYRIPLEPKMRVSAEGRIIYWIYNGMSVLPRAYPIRVNVITGEVMTEMREVIPTYVVRQSRSRRTDAIIPLRKLPGKYVIRNGIQNLVLFGRVYQLNDGLWAEV